MNTFWTNKINLSFYRFALMVKFYLNFHLFFVLFYLLAIIICISYSATMVAGLIFLGLFFGIYNYIVSINFKLLLFPISGKVNKINLTTLDTIVKIDQASLDCTITDIICATAIKSKRLNISNETEVVGIAYARAYPGQNIISKFNIFYVKTIK